MGATGRLARGKCIMFLLADTIIREHVASGGISLGSAVAVVCSWQRNRSIVWAIIAGIFSWFYVIYFALTRTPDEMR
jgi:hypothetical protein